MSNPVQPSPQPVVRPRSQARPAGARPGRKPRLARYRPVPPVGYDDDGYPCSDGAVQSTSHASALFHLYGALGKWMGDRARVFHDLALYYRRGDRGAVLVPDLLVSTRCPPGVLRSYKLWELPLPELAVEVLSVFTAKNDLDDKMYTYEALGFKEYWLFDPTGELMTPVFKGLRLRDGSYERVHANAAGRFASDLLELEFQVVPAEDAQESDTLRLCDPNTGEFLPTYEEAVADYEQERAARIKADEELQTMRERVAALTAAERSPAGGDDAARGRFTSAAK